MTLEVAPVQVESMRTRGGVRLDADIYRPAGNGPWPVLLLRQAYGRRVASTVCYAHPRWYAAQGYVVVVQDVRGRGTSEGVFESLEHEAEDGADAIDWCAALPGTTGEVGMYGFSYQGMIQLLAAAGASAQLKAIVPAMASWDVYGEIMSEGGAPQLAGVIGWAAQVGADTAQHVGDREAYQALRQAAQILPLGGPVTARPDVLSRFSRFHHHDRWRDAGPEARLWKRISPAARSDEIVTRGVPALFVGGWFDFMLPGTLSGWAAMQKAHPDRTRLVVGPWAHLPWGRIVGGHDFGLAAVSDVDRMQIAWFDHWLKGKPLGGAPISLFDLGACKWRDYPALPSANRSLFLAGDGRASVDPEAGRLSDTPDASGQDTLVHDPWRPAPSCGGRYGNPAGPVDRRETDQRGDVITFTGAPLDLPLTICGWLKATIHAAADTASFDLHCALSRVTVEGAVLPFAEGARRVSGGPGDAVAEIDLKASCITLSPGERLRLSIAGASFPAFVVNPGEGDPVDTPQMDAKITTITIDHGRDHPSLLTLTIVPPGMEGSQ